MSDSLPDDLGSKCDFANYLAWIFARYLARLDLLDRASEKRCATRKVLLHDLSSTAELIAFYELPEQRR